MTKVPFWLRSKGRAIAAFWIVQGVVMYTLVIPLSFFLDNNSPSMVRGLAPLACVALVTALQGVFLLPIRRPGVGSRGWPILASMAVAGLMISVLALGAAVAVATAISKDALDNDRVVIAAGGGVLLLSWLIATPLLIAFSRRGSRETMLQRIAARLFLGTIVEAAAIIPLDVLVRRRDDCLCWTGTFFSLTLCGVVGLFVLGPAVFLPIVARRRRRWYAGCCEVCGYDMSGHITADCCPECGAGWRGSAVVPTPEPPEDG